MSDWKKLQKEIEERHDGFKKHDSEVAKLKSGITKLEDQVDRRVMSIHIERYLSTVPHRGVGSFPISNGLNVKAEHISDEQFRKLIRVVAFIEKLESRYAAVFEKARKNYVQRPSDSLIENVKKAKEDLEKYYQLMIVVVKECDQDRVLFMKVFNLLEDAKIMMSIPEQEELNTLFDVSDKMDVVSSKLDVVAKKMDAIIGGIGALYNQQQKNYSALVRMSQGLDSLEAGMGNLGGQLWDMNKSIGSKLDDVNSSVRMNNALTATQVVQNYRTNRKLSDIRGRLS